jgi:hypothetical protein
MNCIAVIPPKKNTVGIAKTPKPPTNATNQSGILPVLAILDKFNFLYKNPIKIIKTINNFEKEKILLK